MSTSEGKTLTGHQGSSLEALRRRSLHKVWWSSARIALERDKLRKPRSTPSDPNLNFGKRV